MIPCYLFTVGNVALSPWPLYERNRLALAILTPLCLALLLLLRRAAKAACFERHERAMLLGFAAFYFAAQMLSAFALRFTPMTDLEQCVSGGAPPAGRGSARSLRAFADLPRPQPAQHGRHLSLLRHLPRG